MTRSIVPCSCSLGLAATSFEAKGDEHQHNQPEIEASVQDHGLAGSPNILVPRIDDLRSIKEPASLYIGL